MARRSPTPARSSRPRAPGAKARADGAPAKSSRQRRPEARPAQIIEAALEVFGERGLANARLDDIAKRAGLAKGTIYLYFPNKEELFRAVIRSTVVVALERAEALYVYGPPEEQMHAFMRSYWTFLTSPGFERIYRLVTGELHNFPELTRFYAEEVIERGLRLLSGMIRRGIEAGVFREMDPVAAARMTVAAFVMHAVWRSRPTVFTHVSHVSDEHVFAEISEFVLAALRPVPPAASHHHPASTTPRNRT
jgi:AcrR family transcriptional regulator